MTLATASGSRIRWTSAAWILLASFALTSLAAWRVLAPFLAHRGSRAVGDGRNPASYGFDLSGLREGETVVASGLPRDGIPVLDRPKLETRHAVLAVAHKRRDRYLVPEDRVIGVQIGAHARAYPLRVLSWHEVVNDTLAGIPIAVTYSPLCDAASVYDRRVEGDTITFGVSGLLIDSNPLLYERPASIAPTVAGVIPKSESPSLWRQIDGRAVTGPRRGASLRVLRASLVPWGIWMDEHPSTTVIARDPSIADRYRRDPYSTYAGDDRLRFPVDPLPDDATGPRKRRVLWVRHQGAQAVIPWDVAVARGGASGRWATEVGGAPIVVRSTSRPATVWLEGPPEVEARPCYWFAAFATEPALSSHLAH